MSAVGCQASHSASRARQSLARAGERKRPTICLLRVQSTRPAFAGLIAGRGLFFSDPAAAEGNLRFMDVLRFAPRETPPPFLALSLPSCRRLVPLLAVRQQHEEDRHRLFLARPLSSCQRLVPLLWCCAYWMCGERTRNTAFPCASAAVLPQPGAFASTAAVHHSPCSEYRLSSSMMALIISCLKPSPVVRQRRDRREVVRPRGGARIGVLRRGERHGLRVCGASADQPFLRRGRFYHRFCRRFCRRFSRRWRECQTQRCAHWLLGADGVYGRRIQDLLHQR